MMRPYLDTVRTASGEMDESLCPACGMVLYSQAGDRSPAMCGGCAQFLPPVDTERTQYGYAALVWYPDVATPIHAFGRVRAIFDEEERPTVAFVAMDGTLVELPLLAVVWDQGSRSLAYTVRGWNMNSLPANVRRYLSSHPTYGIPQVEEVRYLTYEDPAWPSYVSEGASA